MRKAPKNTKILLSLFHTPTEASREMFYCVLRAGHLIAGLDYKRVHPNYPGHKLLLCLKGNGYIQVNGRSFAVAPGQIGWIYNYHANSHWPEEGSPWEMYWIRVDGPHMDQIYKMLTASGSPVFAGINDKAAAVIYRRLLDQAKAASPLGSGLSDEEKLTCHSGLIRATSATAPVSELLPLLEAMSADFPNIGEAANDAIYLRLLTGETNEKMPDRLRTLLQKAPAVLAYRTTLALYELRAGHAAAAAKLYEGWQIDWSTAPDRFKVVRAAVLKAAGRDDEAQTLRATVDAKKLRPEEARLMGAQQ